MKDRAMLEDGGRRQRGAVLLISLYSAGVVTSVSLLSKDRSCTPHDTDVLLGDAFEYHYFAAESI